MTDPSQRSDSPRHPAALVSDFRRTATALADAARAETLPLFRSSDLSTENKYDTGFDPVTQADRAAESAMRKVLAAYRPQDAIRGEEFGASAGTSGFVWVLDPIDGTRAFVSGVPTWGTLIAVCDADGPVHGIIDQPFTGERWEGGPGIARHSGPQGAGGLATRPPRPLAEAILFSTFPEVGTVAERAAFERVSASACLTRFGTDCYAYGLLSMGLIDLVIEAGLHDYDICAPIAVIEAAGGLVTDWTGGPAYGGGQVIAAANPAVHAEALALLAG